MCNMRKTVAEVFTPKQKFNSSMYVSRPELEKQLARSLRKNIHTLLFGESGNGKTWLYQNVLSVEKIPYKVANCGSASIKRSITEEIRSALYDSLTPIKTGFSETKEATVNAMVAAGKLTHQGQYTAPAKDPLLEAFESFSKTHEGRKIIVLDNLESVFSCPELMQELANIIMLLDDPRYEVHNVNFLIVGVPNNVLDYYSKIQNLDSVANRIQEIERVGGLTDCQTYEIMTKGFELLKINVSPEEKTRINQHLYKVTLGVAQRVHEYCEALAYKIEDNDWKFQDSLLDEADQDWVKQGFRKSYTVVESHLNSKDTEIARRNQVIYCIGKARQNTFDSNRITTLIEEEFPSTVPKTNMGIGKILSELCDGDQPLLKNISNSREFCVADPRYIMSIRIMLYKDTSGKICKKRFRI